uniref:BED-type domain-containing protein n=1 Tax=Tetranychus urticae TaxID=32264 RepID=T1K5U2_TETUR
MPSFVWDHFDSVDKTSAKCKHCPAIVKRSGNTTNLAAHLANKHPLLCSVKNDSPPKQPRIDEQLCEIVSIKEGDRKKDIDLRLIWFIVLNLQPFNLVECKEFIDYVKSLSPHASVPKRGKLLQMTIKLYESKKDMVKTHLKMFNWYSFTTDIWTDVRNAKSYIGLTCHFIDNYKSSSLCLGVREMCQSHTSDNIVKKMKSIMTEFEIEADSLVSIATDGAANIKSAAKEIVKTPIWCIAHRLNLIVNDAISRCGEVEDLVGAVRSIVTLSKQSNNFADAIRSEQLKEKDTVLKLKQDVQTRWNSTYFMVNRYLELRHHGKVALIKVGREELDIPYDKIDILNDINNILLPFYTVTLDISGEKYVTVSRAIPVINMLKAHIFKIDMKTSIRVDFKTRLTNNINFRFDAIEYNSIFACATILDPRFKKIDFMNIQACSRAVNHINEMLDSIPLTQSNQIPTIHTGLWAFHDERCKQVARNNDEGLDPSLKHYLSLPTINLSEDPLEYWRKNKESLHCLHNLAIKYLTPTATSVPCERLFSKSGNVITEKRNRLKPSNVEMICFLNSLPENLMY